MELKALHREPVEGFTVTVPNDADMYVWHVAIFGPPDTPYQGGYFKVKEKRQLSLTFTNTFVYKDNTIYSSSCRLR